MPSQGPEFADISEDTVTSFRVAKQWCNSDRINSVDFSSTGDTLIVAHSSDEISVYDCDKSEQVNTIPVRKYGVEIARYAPQPNQLIHTSTKIDHSIRHMAEDPSLNTFKYLHYYRGHTDRVMTLCMSPTEDKFISGSLDRTLRLWKLGRVDCIGIMNLSCRPIAAFDPTGKVFAVGINSACIKLYEVKNFERGPFITFHMEPEANGEWIDLKFSPDGRVIMINTNGSVIRLIDAFTGKPLQTITGRVNATAANLEASFSPDSQYILSGSTDGSLHIWNADTGTKVCALKRENSEAIRCVRFNPLYMLLATGDSAVEFWLPTI